MILPRPGRLSSPPPSPETEIRLSLGQSYESVSGSYPDHLAVSLVLSPEGPVIVLRHVDDYADLTPGEARQAAAALLAAAGAAESLADDADPAGQLIAWIFASPEGQADRVRAALALNAVTPAADDPAGFLAAVRALDIPGSTR